MAAGRECQLVLVGIVCVIGTSVSAEPWLAMLSSGDCADADLTTQTRLLAERTAARVGDGLLTEAEIEARLGPQPTHSVAELSRQLDAAQGLYFEAAFKRAETMVATALVDLERMRPTPEHWKVLTRARLLHAQVLRSMKRVPEAEETMRRVLRLDPSFHLDPDLFPPAFQRIFESVRKDVQRARLVPLVVQASQTGADVFLDGWRVGRTPFQGRLPAGRYRLVLQRQGKSSLPRIVELSGELRVHVDYEFESLVRTRGTPCVVEKGDEAVRLRNAVKLGALLGVSEVVLVRIERQATGPSWLSASLVSVTGGQKIREGGLKLQDTGRSAEGLEELANFIHTGQLGARVVARAMGERAKDERVGAKTDGAKTDWAKREEARRAGERTAGERAAVERAAGERTTGEPGRVARPGVSMSVDAPLMDEAEAWPEGGSSESLGVKLLPGSDLSGPMSLAQSEVVPVRAAWREPVGWISGAAGVSLVVMSAAFQVQSAATTDELVKIFRAVEDEKRGAPTLSEARRAEDLDRQAQAQQVLAMSSFAMGAALGVLSAYLLAW